MIFFRLLLSPFALLYACVVAFRNFLYRTKIYGSIRYDFPVICVGNLSAGGTGKTPHVEYLIRLLQQNNFQPATLSRGYKRKTAGFIFANAASTADDIGDEPLQYFSKFQNISVAVAENRMMGIADLLAHAPQTDVVLLDDAFQHRAVEAGFNLLITRYDVLFTNDYLMPMGLLREFRSGANRAQAIVVSKCPEIISAEEKNKIVANIHQYCDAPVFFSKIKYGSVFNFFGGTNFDAQKEIVFISGIADHTVPEKYLKTISPKVVTVSFADHHRYDTTDLEMIYRTINNEKRNWNEFNLVTTEKDAMRLKPFQQWFVAKKLSLFVLSIEIEFEKNDQEKLNEMILNFVKNE